MELQDRVTVTLTEHGAKILNEINNEFNDRCKKVKPFKTDYKEGDEVTDCLHEIINRFEGQFSVGSNVCFRNLRPADSTTPKGRTDMDKINIREKLKNFELDIKKLKIDDSTRKYLDQLGVIFEQDSMIMGPVKLTAENPNLTRGKHGDIQVKICTGVFSNGKLVSIFEGQPTPVNIPAEKEDPDESVSMEEYDMMSNAYKEAFDECTRLKDKLARIQELIKDE